MMTVCKKKKELESLIWISVFGLICLYLVSSSSLLRVEGYIRPLGHGSAARLKRPHLEPFADR